MVPRSFGGSVFLCAEVAVAPATTSIKGSIWVGTPLEEVKGCHGGGPALRCPPQASHCVLLGQG